MIGAKHTRRLGLTVAMICTAVALVAVFYGRIPPAQPVATIAEKGQAGSRQLEQDNRKLSKAGIFLAANGGSINRRKPVELINPTPANIEYLRAHYGVRISRHPAKTLDGICPEVLVLPNDSPSTTPNVVGQDVAHAVGAVKGAGLLVSTDGCHGRQSGSPAPKPWQLDALTRVVQQCPAPGSVVSGNTFVDIVGEVRLPGGFVYRTQPLSKQPRCATQP